MSHHVVTPKPADDPAFQLPTTFAAAALPLCIVGVLALVGGTFLGSNSVSKPFGMSAYLAAYMFCLTLSIGSLFFVLIQHLSRAGWSVVVRRVAELMMIMIVPLAVLFVPILFAVWSGTLYAWSDAGYQQEHGVPAEIWAEKTRWLNPTWFTIRSVLYLACWAGLSIWFYNNSQRQDETGEVTLTERMQARSGPAIILFAICTTFAAFDWVMSLAPMWFSTMLGVYLFTGAVLAAHAAVALLTYLMQRAGAMRDEVTVEHYHDLGKLIFGFICFWGYIAFSQYMLIWYGNIPEETHWYFVRSVGAWSTLSIVLMVLHWGLPFAGTMSLHVRRRPWAVAMWGAYILVLHFIDMYWVIMPEAGMGVGGAVGVAASVLCLLGMAGLLLGLMLKLAAGVRLVPVRDPRLVESLSFENI